MTAKYILINIQFVKLHDLEIYILFPCNIFICFCMLYSVRVYWVKVGWVFQVCDACFISSNGYFSLCLHLSFEII